MWWSFRWQIVVFFLGKTDWKFATNNAPNVLLQYFITSKNTTTIVKIVNYYATPYLLSCGPFFKRKKCLSFTGKWCPRNARRDSKSQCASKFAMHSKFTTRSILSTARSFGAHLGAEHVKYSQGQKHVIQPKNSQELIFLNMSSQLQLENSPKMFLFQLGGVSWTIFGELPLGFLLGCPSVSVRCLAGRLSGQELLQAGCLERAGLEWIFCITKTDPQKIHKKFHRGTNFTGPKNVLCPQVRDFPRKCSTVRESHKIWYLDISVAAQYPEVGSCWVVLLLRHSDLQTNAQLECQDRLTWRIYVKGFSELRAKTIEVDTKVVRNKWTKSLSLPPTLGFLPTAVAIPFSWDSLSQAAMPLAHICARQILSLERICPSCRIRRVVQKLFK